MDLYRSLNKIWGITWAPIKPAKIMNFTDQGGGVKPPKHT